MRAGGFSPHRFRGWVVAPDVHHQAGHGTENGLGRVADVVVGRVDVVDVVGVVDAGAVLVGVVLVPVVPAVAVVVVVVPVVLVAAVPVAPVAPVAPVGPVAPVVPVVPVAVVGVVPVVVASAGADAAAITSTSASNVVHTGPTISRTRVTRSNRRRGSGRTHPPIGALGLAPQNNCVPSIATTCTPTMLTIIDFAVATPTPTGPPLAV